MNLGAFVRLKKIELKGFKSFCDKSEILFTQDVTGVVGPNGCGKSNIVDAIRWVMGEQSAKNLRGKNMDDVIFAGSRDREPSSMASVEITFDTRGTQTPVQYAQHEEVAIGRKLYRDGTSEYTINKTQVRLKDVTDFFLGTGVGTKAYSIIEQGRVGQIVTAKPEERRHFIEEAAGISKFQIRKQMAQRKMEATQQNLLRLVDIVTEIERQKNSLEKQAKKAEKFKVIRDELQTLDVQVASVDFEKLSTRQKTHLDRLKDADQKQTELEYKVQNEEALCEEARLQLLQVETQLQDAQQKVYETDNLYQLSENDLINRKEALQRLLNQTVQLEQEAQNMKQENHVLKEALKNCVGLSVEADLDVLDNGERVENREAEFLNLKDKAQKLFDQIELAREEKNGSERRLIEIQTQIVASEQRLNEKIGQKAGVESVWEELSEKTVRLKRMLDRTREGLADVKQMKLSLSEQSDQLENEFTTVSQNVKNEQLALEQIKEQLLQKKSRLQSLEELERNFEGYLDGPRSLLEKKRQGQMDSILGSVADFIETDVEYMSAVSAVLGENAQTLVVQTQMEGASCAESLRQMASGRGSFVALSGQNVYSAESHQREVVSATHQPGVRGVVKDFVRTREGFENLKELLFHDTVLVDSLSHALECWHSARVPVATLAGELISREGIVVGGSPEKTSSALLEKKQEIKTLRETVNDLMTQVKAKEELCLDLNRKLKTVQADLNAMKSSCHEEEIKITRQEQDMLHIQQEVESLDAERARQSQLLSDLTHEIETLAEKITEWQVERERQNDILQSAIQILKSNQSEEESLRAQLLSEQNLLTENKILLAEKKQAKLNCDKEVERLTHDILKLQTQIQKIDAQTTLNAKLKIFWESRIAFGEKNITRLLANKQSAEALYRSQKDAFEVSQSALREKEMQCQADHRELSKIKDEINRESLALTELRSHLSRLSEQMLERYQIVLSEVYQDVCAQVDQETFDYSLAISRVQELRDQMSKAGNVNLAAIDELVEINQRYEFLSGQKNDLEKSLSSLEKAINKINQTTKVRFAETFDLVNQKFQQVFPKLFRGGEAYLKLTDPDNILETGVDVIAQPPGKRLQSISLLSGGEKALTAVSMLFSIFLIKPSPFCLLDEVDAPLDDVNVDRYNEIVRDMAQNTQFIVVTHNKRTMQIADALYGVTMEQAGVSQLVSVDIS